MATILLKKECDDIFSDDEVKEFSSFRQSWKYDTLCVMACVCPFIYDHMCVGKCIYTSLYIF